MSVVTGKITSGFLSGLRNGLAPMLGKEMRSRTRGWRSPVLLTVYLGLLSAGAVGFVWLSLDRGSSVFSQVGLSFYGLLVFGLVLLLSFIAPAVAAGAISGERERRTYDLLLVTGASLAGIVLGKWLASVAYLLFLVLAALPLLALVFLFGGVPPATMLMAVLVCLFTGLGYGALGIGLSAVLKRSQAATVVALVLVFLFIFGTLIVAGIVGSRNINGPYDEGYGGYPGAYPPDNYGPEVQQSGVPWYVFMSPLSALTDALPGPGEVGMGPGVPLVSSIMNELMRQFQPRYGEEYAEKMMYSSGVTVTRAVGQPGAAPGDKQKPGSLASWPYWARFGLYQGILAVVSLVVAVLAITPHKPWHVCRAKKRAAKA